VDPILEKSFDRVNEKYFGNYLEKTNLLWGEHSFSKLGHYHYASNTITISKVLADDEELLDYVMYHEMLHKKHKYYTKNGRSHHHTAAFRREERSFENPDVEDKLLKYLRKKKFSFRKAEKAGLKQIEREKKKKSLLDWFFG
jgi:hypothetical protein